MISKILSQDLLVAGPFPIGHSDISKAFNFYIHLTNLVKKGST